MNKEIQAEQDAKDKEAQAKLDEADKKTEEELAKVRKMEEERLKAVKQARDEFNKRIEDEEANTEILKLELQRARQLASIEVLQEGLDQQSEAYRLAEEQRVAIITDSDKRINAQKTKNSKDEVTRAKILEQQKLGIVGDTFGAIADILGKNSKLGKASAIAQATINTYQGITEVWTNKTTLPEPFGTIGKIASTATVLASGLGAVKSIKSQKLPSGGGGGGGGISSASAPSLPSFNIVGSSETNQLASAIGEQTQEPIQAFVVSGEVSTAQDLQQNIIDDAGIG